MGIVNGPRWFWADHVEQGTFAFSNTDPVTGPWFDFSGNGSTKGADLAFQLTGTVTATPEPSTLLMGGIAGVIGLGYAGWRKRRR